MKLKKVTSILLVTVMTAGLLAAGACNKTPGAGTSEVGTSEVPVSSETGSEETGNAPVTAAGGQEIKVGEGGEYIEGLGNGLEDGRKIIEDYFDENVGEWGVYSNGGSFKIDAVDGELVVDISKPGNLDYSCQVYRDGFSLNKGCVYDVEFDIRSDIDRVIQWRLQINGEDYRPYYQEDGMPVTTEMKHVKSTFTMEEASDPAPRFCFNLGKQGDLESDTAHKVYIDNIVVTIADASNAMALEPLPLPIAIKTNQVGYEAEGEKLFIVRYNADVTDFEIRDVGNDAVVYTGKLSEDYTNSPSGGGTLRYGDFTDFKDHGAYYIHVEGDGDSYPFVITDNIYEDAFVDVVRLLTMQRCGMELTKDIAGDFAHPECHTAEATIYGTNETIDVSGGWHDAGDYGRYVVPGAKTVADLFLSYQESEAVRGDDFNIPESGNGVPDILDEARYELEFFFKMQAPDGGVYHKVTCAVFPETVMPEEETDPLIVCPVSDTATGDFAAVMAMASEIYKEYDADFAAKCLDAAKKAYDYLDAKGIDGGTGFVNPEDIDTGEYPDAKTKDEFFWAAVELFLVTGDTKYEERAAEIEDAGFNMGLGWADVGTYGTYDYLKFAKENPDSANADLKQALTDDMMFYAKKELKALKKDVYFISLANNFPWGSNMTVANNAMFYHMVAEITDDDEYEYYASHGLDYLFGINPVGYCYVTGYGTLSPEHTHHRPSQVVGKSVPGMVVGGANSSPSDPYAKAVLSMRKNGKCYVDNASSFSTNEITIYWNSPAIYLLSIHQDEFAD